jgi:toxin-antitoxin system PIN domain toxin
MPVLCDVNLLLAICYDGHVHHPQALDWLEQQDDFGVILCRNTQLGLLRLLSNPAVMHLDVQTPPQAWEVYDLLVRDTRFEMMAEPNKLDDFLRQYTMSSQASPKIWQDAYLAAFARAARLRLATFDQGFRKFDGLSFVLLG